MGMMALTDASRHDWLQGRGPQLTLIGLQDNATGQILAAHFQLEAENTLGYLRALHAMITAHGVPLSLYRDRTPIFQRQKCPLDSGRTVRRKTISHPTRTRTRKLGPCRSPPTRPGGRIERAWRTCPDRLVSELRLAGATALDSANAVLDRFCADNNQRFARQAANATLDFRSLPRRFDLARCLSLLVPAHR